MRQRQATRAVLEVVSPDGLRRYVRITPSPFLIGRDVETSNHLQLSTVAFRGIAPRSSSKRTGFTSRIAGIAEGLLSTPKKWRAANSRTATSSLSASKTPTKSSFHLASGSGEESIAQLLTRGQHITSSEPSRGLHKLNQVLEATVLLHSQLPLDEVLANMLDHAVSITGADRGLLLESDAGGTLNYTGELE